MKLGGYTWRVSVATVVLGNRTYRAVRPRRPAGHSPVYYHGNGCCTFARTAVDRAGAVELAAAWWLAARSPRTIVWLPLRDGPCDWSQWDQERPDRPLDLVMVHHSLQLPVSRWPAIRRRVPRLERPSTVRLPDRPFPCTDPWDHECYGECRDHLTYAVAANTLFLVGSRTAFELEAETIRAVVEDWPARRAPQQGSSWMPGYAEIRAVPPWKESEPSRIGIFGCGQHLSTATGYMP